MAVVRAIAGSALGRRNTLDWLLHEFAEELGGPVIGGRHWQVWLEIASIATRARRARREQLEKKLDDRLARARLLWQVGLEAIELAEQLARDPRDQAKARALHQRLNGWPA